MRKNELDHLYLSKNERLGIFILFGMMLLLIFIPWIYNQLYSTINHETKVLAELKSSSTYDSTNGNESMKIPESNYTNSLKIKPTQDLFEFDPNQLTEQGAHSLGISNKAYRSLQKYLATGARIRSAEQFSKIYGMDQNLYNKLKPFIKIKGKNKSDPAPLSENQKQNKLINLNAAEIDDLIPLPGIGEKLATRIIKYRNLLGGFYSSLQLQEVFGLKDSVIMKFRNKISIEGPVHKININKCNYDTLSKHPYIGFKKAKIIMEYKKQHSAFKEIADLYHVVALDSNWIRRISAYLSFEPDVSSEKGE